MLKNDTETVNKSQCRYPHIKEDTIQNLVQQMLDQVILQPSCIPFAFPMVLVEKRWVLEVVYRLQRP